MKSKSSFATAKPATQQPKLYTELAAWFHLLTAPADYRKEAAFYAQLMRRHCKNAASTVLELGSGGGNMASHLKKHFQLTLTDVSPQMLALSKSINPDIEHIQGDMRNMRLRREFDAVFVHDAIVYMATARDLVAAMRTAFVHCRSGGVAIFAPDYFRENFREHMHRGGHDRNGKSLRYLEWTHDPNPHDKRYVSDFAIMLREHEKVKVEHDRHESGLFSRQEWLAMAKRAGFRTVHIVKVSGENDVIMGRVEQLNEAPAGRRRRQESARRKPANPVRTGR